MLLSVVAPVYNEAGSLPGFHQRLLAALELLGQGERAGENGICEGGAEGIGEAVDWEIVYVDDGSADASAARICEMAADDARVRLVALTRNFGKEAAIAAGLSAARGQATVVLDSDGQHPPELIGQMLDAWWAGAKVVVGVRDANPTAGLLARVSSGAFYRLFAMLGGPAGITPGGTDFCLLDASARDAFARFSERGRLTRGIIQSLGFERAEVHFTAQARIAGKPTYSRSQLARLARDSVTSSSSTPLRFPAMIGTLLAAVAFVTGLAVLIQQVILGDPLGWDFTGTAMLGLLITFLTGLILVGMGIMSLYLAAIHREVVGRPLYLVDQDRSIGL
ncbi:MAG: glycosyltransferase family 2 protein [Bifidobacteriaceae bacterium]|jgi:glycosyltransferase involved in cell wall biosynthesis|nr:glycosyltransferase family 2 protein [Bifidobacteriaceae bacterium]